MTNDSEKTREFLWDAPKVPPNENDKNSVRPLPLSYGNVTPTFDSMNPHMASLQDEHSSYFAVSKACLFFNQLASYGSCSVTPPNAHVLESNLFHVEEYANNFSSILRALSSAASNHFDRRCRILALHSLSIVCKAIVAKLVLSSISHVKDNVEHCTRLQDEICNDMVMNMISCALEDDDDGVATVAFEALGKLIIDSNSDPFTKEVRMITGDAAPLSYSCWGEVSPLQDLDCTVENSKIRTKILTLVMAPKVRHIFTRILLLKSTEYRLRCLPFLSELVIHVYSSGRNEEQTQNHDKKSFAKRWYELDTPNLVQEYVELFLLPLLRLKQTSEGIHFGPSIETGVRTATYGLMLVSNSKGHEIWMESVISVAIRNLELALERIEIFESMEIKMEVVATLLVAIRGINMESQMKLLSRVIDFVSDLPSTRIVPPSLTLGAIYHKDGSRRKPVRLGYWTEVAIAFLFPGRNYGDISGVEWSPQHFKKSIQYRSLLSFLESDEVSSILKCGGPDDIYQTNVIHCAHEMVFVFCSVAHAVGNSIMRSPITRFGQEIWIGNALNLLQYFMPCLGWTNATTESQSILQDPSTFIFGAQRAYVELLRIILVYFGKIVPNNSIYYHFIMSIEHSPSDEEDPSPWATNEILENHISLLLDKLLQQFITRSLPRKIRLSILCLLSDVWIQHCQSVITVDNRDRGSHSGPIDIDRDIVNIQERHARTILSELGSEISSLIDGEKKRINSSNLNRNSPVDNAGEELRSLLACISCVESMAYSAQQCANHFMSSKGKGDIEEHARYLVSVSMLVLKGQGKVEANFDVGDKEDDDTSHISASQGSSSSSPPRSPRSRARITAFTSECTEAAKRLNNFVGPNNDVYDFDGNEFFPVDFNCLCPLLKRSNFGVPLSSEAGDITGEKMLLHANSLWKLTEHLSLIECDPGERNPYVSSIDVSILFLLDSQINSKQSYDEGLLFHLSRQQVSLLVGSALVSRIMCLTDTATSEQKYLYVESIIQHRIRKIPDDSKSPLTTKRMVSQDITGCSDPLFATMGYSVRHSKKEAGNDELSIVLTLAAHNITPVPLHYDIEMDVTMLLSTDVQLVGDKVDVLATKNTSSLHPCAIKAKYLNQLEEGHHLIWEIAFSSDHLTNKGISASISLIGVPDPSDDKTSNLKNVDVIFKSTFQNISTPNLSLVPSPHVFYFGQQYGDQKIFLFLWQNMQFSIPGINIPNDPKFLLDFPFLTVTSSLDLDLEQIRIKAWALVSFCGQHVLAVAVPSLKETSPVHKLYVKGSDKDLIEKLFLSCLN